MSTVEITGPVPTRCDLELAPRRYCDQPVAWYALAATPPELWEAWDDSPRAALAGFCCREHAERAPRASLADAEQVYADVADGCGGAQYAPWPWRPLLDTYPNPIPATYAEAAR